VRAGEQVLAMACAAAELAAVGGMAHEVLGLAALRHAATTPAPRASCAPPTQLPLARAQARRVRVLRELLKLTIARGEPSGEMPTRFLAIDAEIEASDRAKAADDFDARLKYAEREFELLRLRDEADAGAGARAALAERNRQAQWLSAGHRALLLVLGAFFLQQRRANRSCSHAWRCCARARRARSTCSTSAPASCSCTTCAGACCWSTRPRRRRSGIPPRRWSGARSADFQPRRSRADFDAYLDALRRRRDEGVFLVRAARRQPPPLALQLAPVRAAGRPRARGRQRRRRHRAGAGGARAAGAEHARRR
jgi:hypothetical protein